MREFFLSLFGVFFLFFGVANALTPVSQYGQIQNVQTYSSNPFWNPNGPYNQRMPQPVYVQGADMNAGDCQRTVSALVANVCATMNNCKDARLTDVRPTLMVQLSRLPGHNYATACSGYIDEEFDKYVKQYANTGAVMPGATFPVGTQPVQTNQPEIKNPFDAPMPQWQQEMQERAQDLEALSAASGYDPHVERASFPTTFADLSFSERMDIKAQGYEPFKDVRAYQEIKIEDKKEFEDRMDNLFCVNNPDHERCKQTAAPVNNGGNALAGNGSVEVGNGVVGGGQQDGADGIIWFTL